MGKVRCSPFKFEIALNVDSCSVHVLHVDFLVRKEMRNGSPQLVKKRFEALSMHHIDAVLYLALAGPP